MKYDPLEVPKMSDTDLVRLAYEQNEKIWRLQSELKNCRNEFCLKCGNYHESYAGACDGCRYRRGGEWEADLHE